MGASAGASGGGAGAGGATDPSEDELGWPIALPPEPVGVLVGPGAGLRPEGVRIYGTDLGLTYEHDGKLFMLFGDTWPRADFICDAVPVNDDTVATLPRSYDGEGMPHPTFVTAEGSLDYSPIRLLRDGTSLPMGGFQAPIAAFSDGARAFGIFARLQPQRCDEAGVCPGGDGFACSQALGVCDPPLTTAELVCELGTTSSCYPGQQCVASLPMCVDPGSSQVDGTTAGDMAAVVQEIEIAAQRPGNPEVFDSAFVWPTNKFTMPAARTVAHFTGEHEGSDYRPGHGELLVWGRPGWAAEHGREARVYLMRHALPLPVDAAGKLQFAPRYFAGLDPQSGEPIWSPRESDAQPLALDGEPGGDPHEQVQIVGMTAVSWLGAPINRWVMLYGGDLADFLMTDPPHARLRAAGAVMMRFATHPWGPWSLPQPHLSPGLPARAGDLYGPGGILYHPDCADTGGLTCARSDPYRPLDSMVPGCPVQRPELDPGRLYGVNVIDSYTQPAEDGGLEMYWNVSTWNPYRVVLMKTRLHPASSEIGPDEPEVADTHALSRMSQWRAMPVLADRPERYVQQTSRDRQTEDDESVRYLYPLSENGNRDFNNFLCASEDATIDPLQVVPFVFDEERCAEDYVRGAVLARFEGKGRLVRTWIGMSSLLFEPADDEVLRIYVDDEPEPLIEVLLAEALDGSAGEIFAPPFGAGSPRRLAWYYPVSFGEKLIVALDNLGPLDEYFYHCDVALDSEQPDAPRPRTRLPERDRVLAQLSALYHPAGNHGLLGARETIELLPGGLARVDRTGPATLHELRVRVPANALDTLSGVRVTVRWDGAAEPAIDVPLLELFASDRVPPERSNLALTSYVESNTRTLALKLPMPFASSATWSFRNEAFVTARFALELAGEAGVPAERWGHLHVQRTEVVDPTDDEWHYVAAEIDGRGRLVGLCGLVEGWPDLVTGGYQLDPLNLLEGDVLVQIDGSLAVDGTGTEEYADDAFYFVDAPQGSPFAQAWGLVSDLGRYPPGQVSFCRWHVLGTELDFAKSLQLTFELGGAANPWIVDRHRSVAFYYLAAN